MELELHRLASEKSKPVALHQAQPTVAKKSPARSKLHLGHFAFMRSLVQGIEVGAAWDRYLRVEGEYRDARTVGRTISWLRGWEPVV